MCRFISSSVFFPRQAPGLTGSANRAITWAVDKKPSLYSLTLKELMNAMGTSAPYLAGQIFHWIYKRTQPLPEAWTNVSKKTKEFLYENYNLGLPKILWHTVSSDGTRKFLLAMDDARTVESVVIAAKNRLTLCISSQVGCAIGCTFCYTGTMGLTRHLEAGEIVGQFVAVSRWLRQNIGEDTKLTNVVYMGQGEPLHNFERVRKSVEIFMEDKGIGLGQRKITLSTSGLVPEIKKLWSFPPVNIAISLHAAYDDTRSRLMPINRAFDLKKLFEAIKTVPLKAHRRITYEYIMIAGINDTERDVKGLASLLDAKRSKINLIPFNEYPQSAFRRPTVGKVRWFQEELLGRGYNCTVRTTKGDDILAACGQLKSK